MSVSAVGIVIAFHKLPLAPVMLAKLVTVTDVLTKNPRPISVLRIVAVPDVLIDAVVTLAVGAVVSPIARIGRTPWVKDLPQLSFPHVPSALGKFHVSA